MVFDKGNVAEFAPPFELLANNIYDEEITKCSIFSEMVKNTGA
jgi:hypothetical protein